MQRRLATLPLLTLLLLVPAALAAPPPSHPTAIVAAHRQLVIFLRGLANSLNTDQASTGTIVGMDTVLGTLKGVFPAASIASTASTRFLQYSYSGSSAENGLPLAYTCVATVTNSLFKDVLLLDTQIKNAFKTEPRGAQVELYLIGHSLGGVVAMAY